MTKNRSKGVVAYPYAMSCYWIVGDESRFVGYHMVPSAGVCNKEGSPYMAVVQGCWNGMCRRVIQERQDLFGKAYGPTLWGPCCKVTGVDVENWQEGSGNG
jgi:hypothetical protein